jgi:dihydrofolate reductase
MQAPGGSDEVREGGFEHGGWQVPYFDEMAGKAVSDTMAVTGGFLLGRGTYEHFAAYWPTVTEDGEFADLMSSMPKFVGSTTLDEPIEWSNSTLIRGDIAQEVAQLKQQSGKDLQVIGSSELVQTLMQHNLVDEYRLMIHTVVVRSGKRLFREGSPGSPWSLWTARSRPGSREAGVGSDRREA